MMSCTVSTALSHFISSLCYNKHGQRCDVIPWGRITTVAISRSGQLGLHCTVEPNCSDMSARPAGASVTHGRALDTCKLSCVLGQLGLSLFLRCTVRWWPWHTWQHRSSPLGEAMSGPRGSVGAHLARETRSGAEEHVAAPELSSQGGRTWSHGTRGPELRNMRRRQSSVGSDHRLLVGSTIGSFADQPSALLPMNRRLYHL
jgi:hypothetical protein